MKPFNPQLPNILGAGSTAPRGAAPAPNATYRRPNKRHAMLIRSTIALATAAIVLGATVPSMAKDSGPPNIDIQKTCRESSAALGDMTDNGNQDSFSTCMNDEQTAREQMVKDWASYPALAKAQCVQPMEYLPGYVEWQA